MSQRFNLIFHCNECHQYTEQKKEANDIDCEFCGKQIIGEEKFYCTQTCYLEWVHELYNARFDNGLGRTPIGIA